MPSARCEPSPRSEAGKTLHGSYSRAMPSWVSYRARPERARDDRASRMGERARRRCRAGYPHERFARLGAERLRAASGQDFLFVEGSIVRAPSHQPQANGAFVANAVPFRSRNSCSRR